MFNILYMSSARGDRTARAVIRDEALRLFAEHGPDRVTVRRITAAAGVSPALLVHHFGSKQGLRDAVDEHVLAVFDDIFREMAGEGAGLHDPAAARSLAEAIVAYFPAGSAVPAYLRRLLLADGEAARQLFRRLYRMSTVFVNGLVEAGLASPGADPPVRVAFLMANDLAVLLLRDYLADVTGTDPLSREGMTRWAGEVLAIYGSGLLTPPGDAAG